MANSGATIVYGLRPLLEAAKKTPTGQHLSSSAYTRLAVAERLQREGVNTNEKGSE